jgi:hypothetical protein
MLEKSALRGKNRNKKEGETQDGPMFISIEVRSFHLFLNLDQVTFTPVSSNLQRELFSN